MMNFGRGFCADVLGNGILCVSAHSGLGLLVLIEVSGDTVKSRLVRYYKSS